MRVLPILQPPIAQQPTGSWAIFSAQTAPNSRMIIVVFL